MSIKLPPTEGPGANAWHGILSFAGVSSVSSSLGYKLFEGTGAGNWETWIASLFLSILLSAVIQLLYEKNQAGSWDTGYGTPEEFEEDSIDDWKKWGIGASAAIPSSLLLTWIFQWVL